jgi:hypothetical protein
MKLIKYVCDDCRDDWKNDEIEDFTFYLHHQNDWEKPYCPDCGRDDAVTNEGEIDAEEL